MADYLLDLVDLGAPYLPRAVTAPLYTLISQLPSSPSEIIHNPTSLVPLFVTVLSAYFAFNQFIGTARWAVRTVISLLKLGVIASTFAAVYMGYENAGTEKGVVGGIQEAYHTAERVGRGVFSVGQKGFGWYFGNSFGAKNNWDSRSARRTRRSTTKSTNAKKRMWEEDPEEVDLGKQSTDEFVKNAMDKARGIWGIFNSEEVPATAKKNRNAKQTRSGSSAEGGGGFVWNLLANQAKKVWNDAVQGLEQPGVTTSHKNRNRRG
ncbi:uncharacterized protein JCM15063_004560 [Sporobolomyces koalae]|uniref:uncharacterized protein n=1 Tax=Sporobolomyces koalae TaxID=500713 RepID=UPI0031754A10